MQVRKQHKTADFILGITLGAYSKLHDKTYEEIKREFPHYRILENRRPDWLLSSSGARLEIDLYIEQIDVAIEIQGQQHFEYTPHFHKTYKDFQDQKRRDEEKRAICKRAGVPLVEIACYMDLKLFIGELVEKNGEMSHKIRRHSLMRNRRYREWAKRKMLQKRGLLPPTPYDPYCLSVGSRRSRRRAKRKLWGEKISQNSYLICGGRDNHIVTSDENGIHCDCIEHSRGTMCSHIIRYGMEIYAAA